MEPNINGSEMFNDIDVEKSSQLTEGIDEINFSQSSSNFNANNMTQSFAQEISSVDFIQDTKDTKDTSVQLRYMRSAHNLSHLSPGKMKATIRQYVNWKGTDKDIDRYVKECSICSTWSKSLGEPVPHYLRACCYCSL